MPLRKEEREGGREMARETLSTYQDTSEECRRGEQSVVGLLLQSEVVGVWGTVTCCFSLPYLIVSSSFSKAWSVNET